MEMFDDGHRLGDLPEMWSPSMVNRYTSCPRAWALIYGRLVPLSALTLSLRDLPEGGQGLELSRGSVTGGDTRAQSAGTLAHVGMEAAYLAARDLSLRTVGMRMERFEHIALSAMDAARGELDEEGVEFARECVVLTLRALPAPLPSAVLGVESRTRLDLPSGRLMQGIIDLALSTGHHVVHVRDWKLTRYRRLPKSRDLLDDGKMAFYAYSLYRSGAESVTVGLYSLSDQREVIAEMPEAAVVNRMRRYDGVINAAEADREFRPTPRDNNCSSCPVRSSCPVWSK